MKSDREALKQELEEHKTEKKAAKKRTSPTPEQIRAEQKRESETDLARRKAALSATPATPVSVKAAPAAVAMSDNRTAAERYVDDFSPSFLPGPLVKFDVKDKQFVLSGGEPLDPMKRYIARLPDMWVGWVRFHGEGEPPSRIGGLPYDNYIMPPREDLGDNDPADWPLGLDDEPSDPWLHQNLIPIQDTVTGEILTFGTTSDSGRKSVGALMRVYNRMRRANANEVPIIQLKPGDYPHKKYGKVNYPKFIICGKTKYDAITEPEPELPLSDDLNDKVPY